MEVKDNSYIFQIYNRYSIKFGTVEEDGSIKTQEIFFFLS